MIKAQPSPVPGLVGPDETARHFVTPSTKLQVTAEDSITVLSPVRSDLVYSATVTVTVGDLAYSATVTVTVGDLA